MECIRALFHDMLNVHHTRLWAYRILACLLHLGVTGVVLYVLLGMIPGEIGKNLQEAYLTCLRFVWRLITGVFVAAAQAIAWCTKTLLDMPASKK